MTDRQRKLIVLSLKWYDVRIHHGVLFYARKQNWDVVADPHMSLALDIPEAAGQILMIGINDRKRLKILNKYKKPVVDIGNYNPDIPLPRVLPDNRAVGQMAAEAFAERNYKNAVIFSAQPHIYPQDRMKGFQDAALAAGMNCEQWHIPLPDSNKGSYDLSSPLLKILAQKLREAPRPLAAFAIEDEGAALLQRACSRLGIHVPEEISIIGVNNDPLICPYTEVPLSSIDLNWEEVGYQAAARLDRLMRHEDNGVEEIQYVPPKELVVRLSSDIRAVDDLRVARALTYIRNHCHQPICVKDIADNQGTPLRTLQWAFKQYLGHSLNDEIQMQRLEKTKGMLLKNDRKLSDVAESLNFSSTQHLNNYFTKLTGMTPNGFRQQNNKKKPNGSSAGSGKYQEFLKNHSYRETARCRDAR